MNWKKTLNPLACTAWNLFLFMLMMSITRVIFTLLNAPLFHGIDFAKGLKLCLYGLKFDLSACMVLCLPYIVLSLLPLKSRENKIYRIVTKCFFIIATALGLAANLADCKYYEYVNHRSTWAIFDEFDTGVNVSTIVTTEIINSLPLALLGIAILVIAILLYKRPKNHYEGQEKYYAVHSAIFALMIWPVFTAMTGSPCINNPSLTQEDANIGVDSPAEAAVVLNTPFTLYRSIGRNPFVERHYFDSEMADSLAGNPVKTAKVDKEFEQKNICFLILESFSASYSEYLTGLQGEEEDGYMPFLDSLMKESLMWRWSFANGRKSVDAMPSLMMGVPCLVESFVLGPYGGNDIEAISNNLTREKGYSSAFFHGAEKGSMNFEDFAHKAGIKDVFDMDTFNDQSQFDGAWAIWDEPFLQYAAGKMSNMQQPFVSAIFTASSHHPYNIPEKYQDSFKGGSLPMYRSIQYSDNALREFFKTAQKEPWFENTIFVISADHASVTDREEYYSDYGGYQIALAIYAPGTDFKGLKEGIAQQCDIPATLYGILGYEKPYFCYGNDLLNTPEEDHWAINYIGDCYQYFKGDWCLQYDGNNVVGLYDFKHDRLQKNNMKKEREDIVNNLLPELQARIQQYMERMKDNRLKP